MSSHYVQRDGNGAIIGAFLNRQDYATELLPDTDPALSSFLNPTPDAVSAKLNADAQALLFGGTSVDHRANRAADIAGWTYGRNNVAECVWAALTLVCQRAGVAIPTTAEIAAQITALRASDPGVSAADVADQGKRRVTETEITAFINGVIESGLANPRG